MTTIEDYINSAAASLDAGNLKNGHEAILNALRGLLARVEAGEKKPEAEKEPPELAVGQVWEFEGHEDLIVGVSAGIVKYHCPNSVIIQSQLVDDFYEQRTFKRMLCEPSPGIEAQTAERIANWLEQWDVGRLANDIRSGKWRQKAGT